MTRILFILIAFILAAQDAPYAAEPPNAPILRIETGTHLSRISSIDEDRSGKILVTASFDKTVRIWDSATGKLSGVIRPPIGEQQEGRVEAVAITPDGSIVACSGKTGFDWDGAYSLYIFDRISGTMKHRIGGFSQRINTLSFSPDGNYLAVSMSGDGGLILYQVPGMSALGSIRSDEEQLQWVGYSSRGSLLSIASNGVIKLYEKEGLNVRFSITAPEEELTTAAWSPDASAFAVLSANNNSVLIYDARTGELIRRLMHGDQKKRKAGLVKVDKSRLDTVSWSSDGEQIFAGGRLGRKSMQWLWRWSAKTMLQEPDIELPFHDRLWLLKSVRGGLIFSFHTAGFGLLRGDDSLAYFHRLQIADFKKSQESLLISPDGTEVLFNLERYGQTQLYMSLKERSLASVGAVQITTLLKPIVTAEGLNLSGWRDQKYPTLNNKPLKGLGTNENSHALAIRPDLKGFVLGSGRGLKQYDRDGHIIWRIVTGTPVRGINISADNRTLVAELEDGTIRWFSLKTGEEYFALFIHPETRQWVIWTPEGYFDASLGGDELIGYHINQGKDREARFIPVSFLYDVFYRPDIIQAKLRGDDVSALVTLTAEEALKTPPPEVRFTSIPAETAAVLNKVCYQVKSTGGGVGEVRLFQNGKLVKSDGFYREVAVKNESAQKVQLASLNSRAIYQEQRGLAVLDKKTSNAALSKPKGDLVDECVEIEPIAGENEIGVAAFNAPNTIQSSMKTATFTSTRKADEAHLYILAVGIDKYRDASANLKYAAKDAKDFIARLPAKGATIYKPENIHVTGLNDTQAGKAGIIAAIDNLSKKVKQGDGFIFFNASHGVLLQNQYYIVTSDFDGDLSTTKNLISSNEIVEMSKRIKSLSQLFIFDTCHAGGIDNIISGLYDARMSVMAKKMGLHIYASAGSVQSAMDGYQGNGLYTHTLLQGIANGKDVDKEHDGNVTVKELGLYSKEKTAEISTRLGHTQTPFIINFGRDNPLFVVQ
ncbi:MAG: caspase family protein [Desulfuromonadaceae bacterium]|nr:caspase family protein [Desulfuromonadaceae bacterium]